MFQQTQLMITIYSYFSRNKEAKQFATDLIENFKSSAISFYTDKIYSKNYILVDEVTDQIKQIYLQVQRKTLDDKLTFKNAIKVNYNVPSNRTWVVKYLYVRLKRTTIGNDIYLPQDWQKGKSIQKFDKSDSYVFKRAIISQSSRLDGERVIVKSDSYNNVWILPKNFFNMIHSLFRQKKLDGIVLYTLEDFLNHMSIKKFTGEEWANFIDSKQLFEI